jgi:hypothetical protein
MSVVDACPDLLFSVESNNPGRGRRGRESPCASTEKTRPRTTTGQAATPRGCALMGLNGIYCMDNLLLFGVFFFWTAHTLERRGVFISVIQKDTPLLFFEFGVKISCLWRFCAPSWVHGTLRVSTARSSTLSRERVRRCPITGVWGGGGAGARVSVFGVLHILPASPLTRERGIGVLVA